MSIRASSSVSTFEVTYTSSSESEQSNSSVDLCMSFRGSRCTSALIDMIRTFVEFTSDNIHTVFLAFFHNRQCIFWFSLYNHHHMWHILCVSEGVCVHFLLAFSCYSTVEPMSRIVGALVDKAIVWGTADHAKLFAKTSNSFQQNSKF